MEIYTKKFTSDAGNIVEIIATYEGKPEVECEIREYDKKGKVIRSVYGIMPKKNLKDGFKLSR